MTFSETRRVPAWPAVRTSAEWLQCLVRLETFATHRGSDRIFFKTTVACGDDVRCPCSHGGCAVRRMTIPARGKHARIGGGAPCRAAAMAICKRAQRTSVAILPSLLGCATDSPAAGIQPVAMWDWSDRNVCASIDLDQLLTRTTTIRSRAKKLERNLAVTAVGPMAPSPRRQRE